MQIYSIPRIKTRTAKRRGRGVGSGKGFHTTGRGQKGQGARRNIGILFEGVKTKKSQLHRLPMLRGKAKFKSLGKPATITTKTLEKHPEGAVTTLSLIKNNLVRKTQAKYGVKVVGNSKLTKKFEVSLKASKSAQEAIVAAGGKIV